MVIRPGDLRELMLDLTRYNAQVRKARAAYYGELPDQCRRGHLLSPNGGACLGCLNEDKEKD